MSKETLNRYKIRMLSVHLVLLVISLHNLVGASLYAQSNDRPVAPRLQVPDVQRCVCFELHPPNVALKPVLH